MGIFSSNVTVTKKIFLKKKFAIGQKNLPIYIGSLKTFSAKFVDIYRLFGCNQTDTILVIFDLQIDTFKNQYEN